MILALLLAAVAQPAPTPAWLAGRWVPVSDASAQDAEACAGEEARSWRADGSYASMQEGGVWRLTAGKLTEWPYDAEGEPTGGASRVSRLQRIAPDRLRLTDIDGEQVEWRRCR
ncbi:hypothetical protein [Sphingomonas jatrophae]|uniref:Uncharacterized protein n=1 Tax=Sphingomonas jatrophae TaxID=1166337 RepID=A0A1I6JHD5_9SPHN|nr:hypothetical protein [Sphingomonas jatrophae]SFR78396.1 hypothetical protein SAMN05192580_0277 [Sphingomonas jatrophae]